MRLCWKICFIDQATKEFKDRYLNLDTDTLDPLNRAAVEIAMAEKESTNGRSILKFRSLFQEYDIETAISGELPIGTRFHSFCLRDYFEDETGREIALEDLGPILTGNSNSMLIPNGLKQNDIVYLLSSDVPIPLSEVSLSQEDLRVLGYFVRDYHELRDSAFMRDGPGTLSAQGSKNTKDLMYPVLKTAATDEEIRSFVGIFRRLYMENEPANFQKAAAVYANALGDHPQASWVTGIFSEFQNELNAPPNLRPLVGNCTFTTRRLIDVFLYTQYAHQPDERRQRQFSECLMEVNGEKAILTWAFLMEIWKRSLEIGNAGKQITAWFKRYCDHHGVSPDILPSLRHDHDGLGAVEKNHERRARLFREKVDEIALDLWKQNGRPEGGPTQFLQMARERLDATIRNE